MGQGIGGPSQLRVSENREAGRPGDALAPAGRYRATAGAATNGTLLLHVSSILSDRVVYGSPNRVGPAATTTTTRLRGTT